MFEENEYYSDSDEEDNEDLNEDEIYDPEDFYLSETKLDDLIHVIRMCGSKHYYNEIEELILETDEALVSQWIQDLDYGNQQTFNSIENLLDTRISKSKLTTSNQQTPPTYHEIPESEVPSHENVNREIQIDNENDEFSRYK